MSPAPAQPFGRRGTPAISAGSGVRAPRSRPNAPALDLPPALVATILHAPGEEVAAAERPSVTKVAWSFRGAVLAGFVVGILNAAVHATSLLSFGDYDGLIGQLPLGQAKVPIAVMLAGAGLWSGARASALALLFAHNFLKRTGRTSYAAYALAGGAASLAYVLIVETLGLGAHHSLMLDVLSGAAAGFFYRLFAATERT
jgi:hypothetical protein